jgi:hypothetical protein
MTPAEKRRVLQDIEHEGLHYTLESYDAYEDITDPKFHELRNAYLSASKAFLRYVGKVR